MAGIIDNFCLNMYIFFNLERPVENQKKLRLIKSMFKRLLLRILQTQIKIRTYMKRNACSVLFKERIDDFSAYNKTFNIYNLPRQSIFKAGERFLYLFTLMRALFTYHIEVILGFKIH